MRQTRIIRISFLFCAAAAVVAFWTGFYFGKTGSESAQILTASGEPAVFSDGQPYEETELDPDDPADADEEPEDDPAADRSRTAETVQYYLKEAGEYLAVFHSDTDTVYFETDLKLSDLPEDVQTEAKEGVPFHSLEELYDFLESYSS